MRAARSHRGGARCQNKKKGNYGDHHPCLQCVCFSHLAWHDHLDPVRFLEGGHQLEKLEFALALAEAKGDQRRCSQLRDRIADLGGNAEEPGT